MAECAPFPSTTRRHVLSPALKPEPQQPPPPGKAVTKSFPHPRKHHGSLLHVAQGTATLHITPQTTARIPCYTEAQGDGNWGYGQFIAFCFCFLLGMKPFPHSNMKSLPLETVPHTLLLHDPSHRLQFLTNCSSVGPFSTGTDCSCMGPLQGHKSCQ